MFEAHVLHLLRRYLGEYIHGLSSEALRISVWKGDVVLKDLKLKAEALNSLKLPVTVKAGFVGIITLKVPWKSLGKEPVIVLIDRVFVLVHPASDTRSLNVQQDMDKLLEAKLQWIEAAEAATVEAITKLKTKNSSSGNSWFGSLIATTIGNLKISITNVHIRYEDSVSHLGSPFAGGVTLAKLAAVTMDDFGNETFVTSGVLDKLRKSLQLERLAMYHDCNSDPWKVDKKWEDLSRNEWIEMFEDGITEPTSTGIKSALNRNYLVSPINGVLKYHRLGNQERNDPEIPFEKACLTLDDVYLTITENQYHDLIKLLEVVSRYRTCVEISHLRPTVPISDKPFLWWRFASQAILHKRKICYRFSWDQIKHLCQLRRHYVDVYASSLQQMADVNMSELRLIEIELDPKVILLWRLLAHAKVESLKSREALEKKRLGKRSWFSFRWRDTADNVSEDANVEGSKEMEGGLTKEEWQEINKLLSYQPHEDFTGKEMQQMIQFLVDVSVGNAAARIINVDGTEILCGRFEQLYLSTMFKHGSTRCDVLLKFYGLSTPEGSLVQSVGSEQNVNALGASFVRSPSWENLDWKLSATILPCHVTVIVESFDRVIDFMKRSNAVSPTVALETATALQMKIEKVARSAQKQFQMVIEEKSRFCIDIDFDAPKVRVPIRISSTCESHFHLDFGHFTLHTKECPSDEEWKNIYSRCYIQGRDIAAFLTDCSSDCQDCTLLNPNYISPNNNSPTFNDTGRFYSLIDRCRMVVVLDRIKISHPVYPSTRVSIQVPNLRIHFSPERYLRIMQLLNILYRTPVDDYAHTTEHFQNELDLWNHTDLSSAARILVWGGIGKATASWSPCFLTLSDLHLYISDSEKSKTYQRCFSMVGKHISEIPPSNIGGSQFCIAVYTRGIDIVKALESSSTLTFEFSNEEEKSMWIKGLIQATYQASVSPPVDMLGISSDGNSVSSEPETAYLKSADLAIRGTLAEATIILYGNGDRVVHKSDEMPILEVLANGGVVHVIQLDTDLTVKMKLHSLRILDQLSGSTSEPRYLAISVLADNSCMSPEYYSGGKTQSSMHVEEDDIFKDALSDFTYFQSPFTQSQSTEIFGCKNFGIDTDMSPASRSEFGTGNSTPGETFYEAQGVDTSDFVSLMFSTKSSWSLDYMGIDTEMIIRMSKLHFFCSRPTIVALIDFGIEINSLNSVLGNYIIQNPISDECSHSSGKTADNAFVKGLLGSGKARVVFLLQMDIDNVTIFLNKEDGTQLAMLEQESFLLNIKVHPSCISVEGTLGNLRLSDLSLGTEACWCLLCDIRNPGTESLIMFKFESYSPDDEDYEGYDYSLYGRLSSVHIIFLNRFVQEIVAYFTGLATPHAEEAIKLVDKVGNIERWIQKYEIDGASALKFDLSLETPLIIVPKNSMSKDFIQLDLGHLKVTNEFYWHGSPDVDPSSVHIDVLHAEILGINLAVGISGTISKPLIREGKDFDIYVRRSLRDVFRKIPTVSIEVKVGLLHAQMSDKEYSIILDCVYMNLIEEPKIAVNINGTASDSKETLKMLIDRVNISSQTLFSDTVTVIAVEVDCALLKLFNGMHGESPLAQLALEGLWLSYRMTSLSESDLYLTIPKLSVLDIRSDTKPEMRLMLGSSTDVAKPCAGLNIGSHFDRDGHELKNHETADSIQVPNLTMFLMDYRYRISSKSFVVRLQHPRVLVVPDFILAVGEFFVPALGTITGREETAEPSNDPISKNNSIVLSTPLYEQNEDFVILSSKRQLVADSLGVDLYVYDGCGKTLCLCGEVDQKEHWEKPQPIVIIGRGKTLRFVNVKIENGSLLRKCTYLYNGSSYSVSSKDGVDIALSENIVYQSNKNRLHNNSSLGSSISSDVRSNSIIVSSFTFDAQAVSPEFTFYDSTKSCLDDSSHCEKLLRAKLELSFMYAWRENDTWVRAVVKDLNVEAGSGLVIIDPFDIVGGYTSVIDGSNLSLALTDVCVHLPLSVISLVLNLQAQVTQAFQSGNPSPLATCTNFDRLWVSPIDKVPGTSLTFWRPRAPPNYVILGDCVTSRTTPPSQAVMAVSNTYGRVRKPLSFELIGSLSAVQGYGADDDSSDCSLWFPIPPTGYHALGCVAHPGKLPPPCHIVYCLRSDLVASTMASECVLCIPPNSIFHSGFSVWRLDNALGSCLARPSNDGPPRGFCYDLNSLMLLKSDHFCSLEHSTSDFNAERDQCGGNDESDVLRRVPKGRGHCISTPNFERVWWDKGGAVQRRLSIWRPIPQPGYGIVGDCIIEGNEPPSVGMLFSDTLEVSKKPLGFTKIAQFGPKFSEVFLWYPIPPPGYVTLGCVVSRIGETPQNEIFCCPRKDLVRPANIFEAPILKSARPSNCWSIWKVENKACTFLGSSNLEKPSSELAFSVADGDFEKAKPHDNMTAELKLRCLSVTFMDSLCGMMSPLFDITATNIKLATCGQTNTVNAVLIASIAASSFNMQLEDWEPLVEAFDAILKFETYDGNANHPSGYGKRVRLAASSILNINISASNMDTFIQMILSWRKQSEIESKASQINMGSGKCYNKMDDSTLSALDENDFQTVVIENKLGCDVYVKKEEDHNSDEVELLKSDGCTVVWVPPPRFTNRLNVADEFREARRYVSVVIFESKGFSTADDGNGHNIFCTLRLIVGGQQLDQQKMFLQSARTKCIKPSSTETGEAVVQWNELFIFEVPPEGEAKLEVKVTNLAAKAGKGEVIGAVCLPIRYNTKILKKVASSRMISLPSETLNIVPHTLKQDEVGNDEDNLQGNGLVFISTTFFEKNKLPTFNSSTGGSSSRYDDRGVGFSIGLGSRGSWESFGSLLPLSVTPKRLEGDLFAMEVSMKNGKKHVVLRGLATVVNDSDISLDVYIHHTSKIDHRIHVDSTAQNTVMEEVFENQWYRPDSGWSETHTQFPGNWSTRDFALSSKEFIEPPLPAGWKWLSTWTVDKSSYVDMDGWAYGRDFQNMQWPPSRFTSKSAHDTVRRRRWVNTRQKCDEAPLGYNNNVFSVSPGSYAVLPWRTLIKDSEQCLQIRPHVDHPHALYSWGSAVSLASSVKDQSLISRGLLAQGPLPRQSTSRREIKAPSLFILDRIEKRDMLICSAPSDQRKKLWLSVCSDASVLHTGLNVPVYDWKISVNSPLKIDNRLPCEAEYMVWGRQVGTMTEMQRGVISSRECVHVYSVDVQRPIYLTLFVQGGWTLEKDPVLVLDLISNNHVSSFRMIRQGDKRKLRVSIEHDLGGSIAGTKTVRLFVPYWISNDSSLSLGYRLVEVEPSPIEDSENASFPRGDKSGRMTLKKPTNTLDRRFSLSRKNYQVFEVIEDEAPVPSMLSPPDYRANNDIMMFSSSKNTASLSPRIGISVAMRGSDIYSTGISLCDLENKEIVDVNAFQSDGFYHKLSASLTMTSDRTKVIHFKPQMLFLNRIGCSVCIQQCDSYSVKWIHPTDPPKCFGWSPSPKGELLRLRLDGYNWSYPFSVPTEGVMRLSLKKDLTDEEYVRIVVRSGAKTCHYEVIFRPNSFSSPYRIENVSMFLTMNFRQVGGPFNSWNPLPPNAAAPFFWEDLGRDRLLELLINGTDPSNSVTYNINEISDHYPIIMDGASARALHVTIMTEDKINVVRISDLMPGDEHRVTVNRKFFSFEPRPSTFSGSYNTSESFTSSNCEFNLIVDIAELGLSLVDHTPEEILYLSIQNFQFSYLSSLDSGINRYKLRMGGIQVDNQLPLTHMPVLFKPQRTAGNTDYILKLSAITQWNGTVDLCVYPYLDFHGPENTTFLINIHEPIIWRLHECIQHVNFARLNDPQMTAVSVDPIINIGVLSISEFRLKVSMAMSPSQRPKGVLGFWSSLMTALGNTENMPVKINPRLGENFCKRQSALITYAVSEIQKDLLSQPLQLLSGVDILGNASSALGHMSKGVAALSMDTKFIQSRQRKDSKGVEDFGDVIREGGGALAKGFFRGVTGILTKPIEGAKSSGVEGFVQGVGKGLIGAAAQPVSGVLDLLSKTTEGANAMRMKIASAITSEGQLIRRRLPRAIGGDNLLRPYDEYKAQGQVILQLAESGFFGQVDLFRVRGKFALSDEYEDHFLLPEGKILEITHRRVVLLQKPGNGISQNKFNAASDPCVVLWDVLWGDLVTMEMAYMKDDNPKAPPSCVILYSGPQSGELKDRTRAVKCRRESNQAHEIYTSIHQALSTYGPNQSKEEERRKRKKMVKPYSPIVDDNRGGDIKDGDCGWSHTQMVSPSFVGGG